MARGTQLSALVDQLRAEIGASTNVAMGVNMLPILKQVLKRTQERLWADFDWPFAWIERDEQLLDGQRYYTFDNDIDFDRIRVASLYYGNVWRGIEYGITPANYNLSNPDLGMKQDPIQRWRHWEGNQFEVWPVPSSSTTKIRFKAIKKLNPLISDSDTAELDDNLIVLFAAAEMLARAKSQDASYKLQAAQDYFNKLKGNMMKSPMIVMGGGLPTERQWFLRGAMILPSDRVGN
jgi:hypothetical protein